MAKKRKTHNKMYVMCLLMHPMFRKVNCAAKNVLMVGEKSINLSRQNFPHVFCGFMQKARQ